MEAENEKLKLEITRMKGLTGESGGDGERPTKRARLEENGEIECSFGLAVEVFLLRYDSFPALGVGEAEFLGQ